MGVLRITVAFASLIVIRGKFLLREPVQNLHNVSSNCVPLKADSSGASYTLTAKLDGKPIDLLVDTGSPYLLIADPSKAPGATDIPDTELEITYGTGIVYVHEAKAELQVGPNDFDETIYLVDKATADFPNINGVYPLGTRADQIIHSESFSVCFSGVNGNLALGASGASVPADSKWKIEFTGLTVNGVNVGVSGEFLPDTGTTLLVAPLDHLDKLLEKLCSEWSDCQGETSVDFIDSVRSGGCSDNLPPIDFSMAGSTISLSSNEYLIDTGGKCDLAFTYFDDGEYWILGIPLFQAYLVAFDYNSQKIGFQQSGCECGGLLEGNLKSAAPQLKLKGPPRISPFSKLQPQLTEHEGLDMRLVELAKKLSLERFQQA